MLGSREELPQSSGLVVPKWHWPTHYSEDALGCVSWGTFRPAGAWTLLHLIVCPNAFGALLTKHPRAMAEPLEGRRHPLEVGDRPQGVAGDCNSLNAPSDLKHTPMQGMSHGSSLTKGELR